MTKHAPRLEITSQIQQYIKDSGEIWNKWFDLKDVVIKHFDKITHYIVLCPKYTFMYMASFCFAVIEIIFLCRYVIYLYPRGAPFINMV